MGTRLPCKGSRLKYYTKSIEINIINALPLAYFHRDGVFKGPAKGQCLNCMDEQEYDLTVLVNRKGSKYLCSLYINLMSAFSALPIRAFIFNATSSKGKLSTQTFLYKVLVRISINNRHPIH